ncbi:MAG: ABC transporter permease, partial [Phycisphaerae bacterium]
MTSLTTPSSIHPAAPRGLLRALWRVPRFFGRAAWSLGMRFERQWQNVLTALVQVWVNKARALLTTLGIIIAVTSTITVVSLVQGFGTHITDMLRGFGTNMI